MKPDIQALVTQMCDEFMRTGILNADVLSVLRIYAAKQRKGLGHVLDSRGRKRRSENRRAVDIPAEGRTFGLAEERGDRGNVDSKPAEPDWVQCGGAAHDRDGSETSATALREGIAVHGMGVVSDALEQGLVETG